MIDLKVKKYFLSTEKISGFRWVEDGFWEVFMDGVKFEITQEDFDILFKYMKKNGLIQHDL